MASYPDAVVMPMFAARGSRRFRRWSGWCPRRVVRHSLTGFRGRRGASLDDRGWAHLRIARELDRAGRGAEALGWAERGLEEATRPEAELVEYAAARYAAAGRPADVLALRRTRFRASPALESYQALRQAATACGAWPSEREAALTALREDARSSSSSISGPHLFLLKVLEMLADQ